MWRHATLAVRLALVLTALMVAAVALTSALNLARYRSLLVEQEHRIYELVLVDLSETMRAAMASGRAPESMTEVQALMDRKRAQSQAIRRISVFALDGRVLLDTDLTRIGSVVPASWLVETWREGRIVWTPEPGRLQALEQVVVDAQGKPSAIVVVLAALSTGGDFNLLLLRAAAGSGLLAFALLCGTGTLLALWFARRLQLGWRPAWASLAGLDQGTAQRAIAAQPVTASNPVGTLTGELKKTLDDLQSAELALVRMIEP